MIVKNGINLFGNCKNKKCIAFNKEVCECPLVKLETCGFRKCRYSYIGTKIENQKFIPVNYNNSISEDHMLDYFEAGANGKNKSLWVNLKITANPL